MKTILSHLLASTLILSAYANDNSSKNLYWGDTHNHTGNSFDVYAFGTTTSTPDTAYRYAKGEKIKSPTTGETWQLSQPLDFLVVADHAELLGALALIFNGNETLGNTKSGKIIKDVGGKQSLEELQAVYDLIASAGSGIENEQGLTAEDLLRDLGGDTVKDAWNNYIDVSEKHNEPGKFTTLLGWEWSSNPQGGNMHRVIFMREDGDMARKMIPFSSLDSLDVEDLWAWLKETEKRTSANFVAIPHNPNISNQQMFAKVNYNNEPLDAEYAKTRMRWEPVIELAQTKGDSETHPLLSPDDQFADFETFNFLLTPEGTLGEITAADYVRSGLKTGLELENELGVNPFKYGLIGSSDSHTGVSSIEETNFGGKGQHDSTPELRSHPTGIGSSKGWDMSAAGLVGVWAEENTRASLFDAFKRKEVYASTGPRIQLRFFGGYEFTQDDLEKDMVKAGYDKGVPMGGDLVANNDQAPQFLIKAVKDPNGANLDRVQVVKGWLDNEGKAQEKVFDVALSDGRKDGSELVGNSVDLKTGKYTNDIGDTHFSSLWQDPEFDSNQNAFYYVRVLEIPTPRYSLLNAIELGIDYKETGRPATIQERAYSSPIWYSAQK